VPLVCPRHCFRHWEYNDEQAANYSGGRKIAKSVNKKVDGDVIKSDWALGKNLQNNCSIYLEK